MRRRTARGSWPGSPPSGSQVVTVDDAAYPGRLAAIEFPPHLLFVHGDVAALAPEHAVAVVGTRRATIAGRGLAARIAHALSAAGATIVSGLALGIDGAAHAATVDAGGRTVAVIGGGHGQVYPRAHARLARAIVDAGGAVVSELAPDFEPTKGTFPRRNRVISGLADATVVIEAPARSGALVTASWALEQGRDCFLVPGRVDDPASAGCLVVPARVPRRHPDRGRASRSSSRISGSRSDPTRRVPPPWPAATLTRARRDDGPGGGGARRRPRRPSTSWSR